MPQRLPHDCQLMRICLDDVRVPVEYDPQMRRFEIPLRESESTTQGLSYCPFCGAKLPKELRDEWFDEMESRGRDTGDPVPAPFDTDEWWWGRPEYS